MAKVNDNSSPDFRHGELKRAYMKIEHGGVGFHF